MSRGAVRVCRTAGARIPSAEAAPLQGTVAAGVASNGMLTEAARPLAAPRRPRLVRRPRRRRHRRCQPWTSSATPGRWYEIARLPFRFQEAATPHGHVLVQPGPAPSASRTAASTGLHGARSASRWARPGSRGEHQRQAEGASSSGPSAATTGCRLGPAYEWALVGDPARRYMWILSRTPRLPGPTYDAILAFARDRGYDVARLIRTPQPAGDRASRLHHSVGAHHLVVLVLDDVAVPHVEAQPDRTWR